MKTPVFAAYGSWHSDISAEDVAAGVRPLGAPRIDGARLRWLEGQPHEGGRLAVVEYAHDGTRRVVTPPPFNVRSRVHEYGGGAYAVAGETIWFSNFADNLVYEQTGAALPRPLCSEIGRRHADFELDLTRQRLIAVCEDHTAAAGQEPRNSLVALSLTGTGTVTLAEGFDFFASPRLSPDGQRIAWLSWNHPQMPWQGTQLWLAAVGRDGMLMHARRVAGNAQESLCQPVWSPDGRLYVVSDRSGWWNLYRLDAQGLVSVLPMAAEFGLPQWVFAQSSYGFSGPQEIIAVCRTQARSQLLRIALAPDAGEATATRIDTAYDDISELRVGAGFIVLQAGAPTIVERMVRIDLADGAQTVLVQSTDALPDQALLSMPQTVQFVGSGGAVAHAFHYPPHNPNFRAAQDERPPLIVISHGGPTAMSTTTLRLNIQFWTSRGFAVLDVNYGGSTGYGRAYRERLSGQWGVVDVEDCIAGACHLAARGLVDAQRMAIRGGSAGGYTTLCALTFHKVFKAGASYYGVGDLRALDADTHKFEAHYSEDLLGPASRRETLYSERSPLRHVDRLDCPVIFFQGMEDKVVPPMQSQAMVAAMRARAIPVAYLAFEGEGHGFRRPQTLRRALEAELSFYAQVFGFTPADALEPVVLL